MAMVMEDWPLDRITSMGLECVEKIAITRWPCCPPCVGLYTESWMGHMQVVRAEG